MANHCFFEDKVHILCREDILKREVSKLSINKAFTLSLAILMANMMASLDTFDFSTLKVLITL